MKWTWRDIGSTWAIDNDVDLWAWCTPAASVRMKEVEGEPDCNWIVTNNWQTKPMKRCNQFSIENPISEPPKISGSYIKWMQEATHDREGELLLMSSKERMRGQIVEVEKGRPTVTIAINVGTLPLVQFTAQRGTVNDAPLWGLPKRTILLTDISWERSLYGVCSYYYTINYNFEIKFETWDRFIVDEGSRTLWKKDADPTKLGNYVKYRDVNGEATTVLLDGAAWPAEKLEDVFVHRKELEEETDFKQLGIPTTL